MEKKKSVSDILFISFLALVTAICICLLCFPRGAGGLLPLQQAETVAEGGEALAAMLRGDVLYLLICGSFGLIGVLCLVSSAVIRKVLPNPASFTYFGFILILLSLRMIMGRPSVSALADPTAASAVSCIAFSMVGLPFILFFRGDAKGAWRSAYNVLLTLNLVSAVLIDGLYFSGVYDFKDGVVLLNIVISASLIYIFVERIYSLIAEKTLYKAIETAGLACFFVLGLTDAVISYIKGGNTKNGAFVAAGLFIFAMCMTLAMSRELYSTVKQANEQSIMLEEAKTQLVLSQIKPHFVYNSLGAIRVLIKKDPDKAYDVLYKFSKYLRQNIDALGDKKSIPFEVELEHIKTYLELEGLRFPGKFDVDFAVSATNFLVPPLSIQIFVENALKYGIFNNPGGGTVTIRTYASSKFVYIEVEDNGAGFDMKELESKQAEGRSVGVKNAVYRIEKLQNGKCEIKSAPGEGTLVFIKLPKMECEAETPDGKKL